MSEYRRSKVQGGTYFFTVNTYCRQALLTQAEVRNALRLGINLARTKHPFIIDAWVLLPDHLHCIWTLPEDDANFGIRWSLIKRTVSKQCEHLVQLTSPKSESRIKRNESRFWQRRFWEHQIRDELDYQRHADYLHFNPVKHKHVSRVADWPYSTFHKYVERGIYPSHWAGTSEFEAMGEEKEVYGE